MIRLVGAVTHVPGTRGTTLGRLMRRLDIPFRVIPDEKREGCWPTVRRGWLNILDSANEPTHGIVLADDMWPCSGFRAAAEAAIAARPDVPIVLICARPKPVAEAVRRGVHWIESSDGAWGGSTVLPIDMIREFVEWSDRHVSPEYPHDDGRLALWAFWTGRRFWLTVPSLLDHALPDESLLGHGGGKYRTAAWWADDARDIDWTPTPKPPTSNNAWGPVTRREAARIEKEFVLA